MSFASNISTLKYVEHGIRRSDDVITWWRVTHLEDTNGEHEVKVIEVSKEEGMSAMQWYDWEF